MTVGFGPPTSRSTGAYDHRHGHGHRRYPGVSLYPPLPSPDLNVTTTRLVGLGRSPVSL